MRIVWHKEQHKKKYSMRLHIMQIDHLMLFYLLLYFLEYFYAGISNMKYYIQNMKYSYVGPK